MDDDVVESCPTLSEKDRSFVCYWLITCSLRNSTQIPKINNRSKEGGERRHVGSFVRSGGVCTTKQCLVFPPITVSSVRTIG